MTVVTGVLKPDPWDSYSTSLFLSFLISKVKIIKMPTQTVVMKIKGDS